MNGSASVRESRQPDADDALALADGSGAGTVRALGRLEGAQGAARKTEGP